MKKEDHFLLTFSISLYIYFFIYQNLKYTFIASFLTAFFSWLPDLDIKITKKIEKIRKKRKITYFLMFPIFFMIKRVLKHRGITHSIYLPIILIYLDLVTQDFLISFFLKILYFSIILHILEDSLTKSGVQLFFPLNYRLKIPIFSTKNKSHSFIIKIKSFVILITFFVLII